MSDTSTNENHLINSAIKDFLKSEIEATDEELNYLEKLIKIQKEKMDKNKGSRYQPSVVIDDFLYHGDLGHAIDLDLLLELKIQHIINLCDCPLDKQIEEVFDVLWIRDLEDSVHGNIRKHFDQTNDFLFKYKEKNEKVLVHCQAGISRSSSIVLAYLIKYDKFSLEKAYEYLLDRRSIAAPNHGFLIQLIRYEKEIRNKDQNKENDNKPNPITSVEDSSLVKSQW